MSRLFVCVYAQRQKGNIIPRAGTKSVGLIFLSLPISSSHSQQGREDLDELFY
jgi:hypothetical protein